MAEGSGTEMSSCMCYSSFQSYRQVKMITASTYLLALVFFLVKYACVDLFLSTWLKPRYIWEEGILIEKITLPEYSKWQKKVEYKEKHVTL